MHPVHVFRLQKLKLTQSCGQYSIQRIVVHEWMGLVEHNDPEGKGGPTKFRFKGVTKQKKKLKVYASKWFQIR